MAASFPVPTDDSHRVPAGHELEELNRKTIDALGEIVSSLPDKWRMYDLADSAGLRELYLQRFYDECMLTNFPDKDELDPIEVWVEMFTPEYDTTVMHIIVVLTEDDRFAAGVVAEYYPKSQCGLLSYLLVQPEFRGPALGLVGKITPASSHIVDLSAQLRGVPHLKHYFCETNNPLGVLEINDNMPPRRRVVLFHRLGFSLVNFPYVQYPLADDQSSVDFLLLMVYQRDPSAPQTVVESKTMRLWLDEFALSTGVADGGDDFKKSLQWLDENPFIPITSLLDWLNPRIPEIEAYNATPPPPPPPASL